MGPTRANLRGMGSGGNTAAAVSPDSGSGGAGALRVPGGLSFSGARAEIDTAMSGRITLGVINLAILSLLGFYVWTHSAQGGA